MGYWSLPFNDKEMVAFKLDWELDFPENSTCPSAPSTAELREPSRGTEAKFGDTAGFLGGLEGVLGDRASDGPPSLEVSRAGSCSVQN